MGISLSKRVKNSLSKSPDFSSACDSAFARCLSLTQHAFPGVFAYQLPTASDLIHSTLMSADGTAHTIVSMWIPHPPPRDQIDYALRLVVDHRTKEIDPKGWMLSGAEFREWALVLYAEAVSQNVGKAFLTGLPIGTAGILGVGAVTKAGRSLIGAAVGVYALGLAVSFYLGLPG